MASMYATVPLADALTRIRKAGHRYVTPSPKHTRNSQVLRRYRPRLKAARNRF